MSHGAAVFVLSAILIFSGAPRSLGGATFNPAKGDQTEDTELHPQDHVTITHSNPTELARIIEVVKLMGGRVGAAKAGGSP